MDGQPAPPGPVVRLLNSAGAFLDTRGYGGDIGADTPDDGRFNELAERFAISGSAFVTRRGTWHEIGPFAARFFAYYEDMDWCWRAHLAGKRVLYDPGATVEHRRSASSGGEHEPWVRVMSERNRTLTMVRNGPRRIVTQGPPGPRRRRARWRSALRDRPPAALGACKPCPPGTTLGGAARGGMGALGRRMPTGRYRLISTQSVAAGPRACPRIRGRPLSGPGP